MTNWQIWDSTTGVRVQTQDRIDLDWPHQVIVPSYRCTGLAYRQQMQFGESRTMCSVVGSTRIDDTLFRIFRFKERHGAREFEAKFEGMRYLAVGSRCNVTMVPVIGVVR